MNNDVRIFTWNLVTESEAEVKQGQDAFDPRLKAILRQHADDCTIFALQGNSKYLHEMFGEREGFSHVETADGIIFWKNGRFKPLSQTNDHGAAHVHLEDSQTGRTVRVASINLTKPEEAQPDQKEQVEQAEFRPTRLGRLFTTNFSNKKEDLQVIGMAVPSSEDPQAHLNLYHGPALENSLVAMGFIESSNVRSTYVCARFKDQPNLTAKSTAVENGIPTHILSTYPLSPTRLKKFCNFFSPLGKLINAISSVCQRIFSCIRCKKKDVEAVNAVSSPQVQEGRKIIIKNFTDYFKAAGMNRMDAVGIFGIEGKKEEVDGLYQHIKKNEGTPSSENDVPTVATAFKRYIREELKLFDSGAPAPYSEAQKLTDPTVKLAEFKKLIQGMDNGKKELFKGIIDFLAEVGSHSTVNEMPVANLAFAMVPSFFPTLEIKDIKGKIDRMATLNAPKTPSGALTYIINNRAALFGQPQQ